MKSLQANGENVSLITLKVPKAKAGEVLIKIAFAGICRTDIAVMNGILGEETVIAGHEFSGYVEEGTERFKKGTRVVVNPILSCQQCHECQSGLEQLCQFSQMLGVDRDGAFTEYISVREDQVYEIPANVCMKSAAFLEPIAANLAVFNTSLSRVEKGGILGNNRIAHLMSKIMIQKAYENIDWPLSLDEQYDYLIETEADEESIDLAIRLLKPRGRLIIKSRKFTATPLVFAKLVAKEIQCLAVNYGSYDDAIKLLEEGLSIDDLFGQTFALKDYSNAIEEAISQESTKVFLCAEL